MEQKISQCQVIGEPSYTTWEEYRGACLSTFSGGYHDDPELLGAFKHGINTVFNLLEAEFPQPENIFKAFMGSEEEKDPISKEEIQSWYKRERPKIEEKG